MSSIPRYKRTYRACLNCRVRKVKCDLGSADNPKDGKCRRCIRERKDCVFVESRRSTGDLTGDGRHIEVVSVNDLGGSRSPELLQSNDPNVTYSHHPAGLAHNPHHQVLQQQQQKQQQHDGDTFKTQGKTSDNSKNHLNHFLTMEGALVFLANAAGTIAEADERDHIDAEQKHHEIEASMAPSMLKPKDSSGEDLEGSKLKNPGNVSLSSLLNPHTKSFDGSENSSRTGNNYQRRRHMPPVEKLDHVRPRGSSKLSNFEYIGAPNGILSEVEAETLINLFFTTMHPYFPYIPSYFQAPKVLAGYPILLCAILTISLRYHPFADNKGRKGVARNIEVHDSLWLYVQRLISQTVWAEASTRSIGTILAFLLLTEWNPRAIHWRWIDYANKAEDMKDDNDSSTKEKGSFEGGGADADSEISIAGIGAMRRSFRMGWMLIGSAVRLAQDMDFIDVSPSTFLACHVAEINSVMNISRRLMLSHSLSELDIDNKDHFIGEEDQIAFEQNVLMMREEELKKLALSSALKFTKEQRAKIELLQVTCLAHDAFYGYKAQLGSLSQRQNLAALNLMSPILTNWSRKYRDLLVPLRPKHVQSIISEISNGTLTDTQSKEALELSECINNESLIFEYNYTKLYVYSLALSPSPQHVGLERTKSFKLEEVSKAARFIEKAFSAANEMLSVAHRIHRLRALEYMPVRWVARIVRAIAFVVKCYLTMNKKSKNPGVSLVENFDTQVLTFSLISVDEIMQIIQRAAITLRECSPDELHLATRYSNVLMYLCSEMKTKTRPSREDEADLPNTKRQKTYPDSDIITGNSELNGEVVYGNSTKSNYDPLSSTSSLNVSTQQPKKAVETFYESAYNASNASSTAITPDPNYERNKMPADNELMDWFSNNQDIGLDFVAPWTEMIEQQLDSKDFNFDDALQ